MSNLPPKGIEIPKQGINHQKDAFVDLFGLEPEGLELDFAVLFVHGVFVEVHVAGHVEVYPEGRWEDEK